MSKPLVREPHRTAKTVIQNPHLASCSNMGTRTLLHCSRGDNNRSVHSSPHPSSLIPHPSSRRPHHCAEARRSSFIKRLSQFRYNRQLDAASRQPKPLEWIGSSKKDLMVLPEEVVDVFGYALFLAQSGGRHAQAKPLQGFGSAGVLEWLKIGAEMLFVPSTPSASRKECTCCTFSRRSQNRGVPRPSRTWI